jgi:hypothetical protein
MYRLGRFLQLLGLGLLPVAMAGNYIHMGNADRGFTIKQMLVVAGIGIGVFYLGWWLQQKRQG